MILGGIESGGTKTVCATADEAGNIINRISIPTTTPEETVAKALKFLQENPVDALGIASFGPVDLNEKSASYGCITRTPKSGWANFNVVKAFEELKVPIGFDTDVNGAILGEVALGAAKGCESAIYITIGTGIGVGVYINGGLVHGMKHPEGGHIVLRKHKDDSFEGCCPFHKDCFEGLASGPAIEKRWGKPATELYDCAKVWEHEAYYIAQAIANYILCYSPEKVVLWGGVMHNPSLLDLVKKEVLEVINQYVEIEDIDSLIVEPALGDNAGVIGATQLGYRKWRNVQL